MTRWEESRVLIVTTTHVSYGYDTAGRFQSVDWQVSGKTVLQRIGIWMTLICYPAIRPVPLLLNIPMIQQET